MEKVFVDPYKTSDLGILSAAELAIDDVKDFVSSVVTPAQKLLIEADQGVMGFLAAAETTLDAEINGIISLLPSQVSLSDLLDYVPFLSVLNNLPGFIAGALNMGLDLPCMPKIFFQQGMLSMGNMALAIDPSGMGGSCGCTSVASLVLGVTPPIFNPFGQVAALMGAVAGMINCVLSTINRLVSLGLSIENTVLAMIAYLPSQTFGLLSYATRLIDTETSYFLSTQSNVSNFLNFNSFINRLGNILPNSDVNHTANSYKSIGPVYTHAVNNVVHRTNTSSPSVVNIAHAVNTYTFPTITKLNTTINTLGATTVNNTLTVLNTYSLTDLEAVLPLITQEGVAAYEAADTSGKYSSLLSAISNTSVDDTNNIFNVYATNGYTNTAQLVNDINNVGSTDMTTLLTTVTDSSDLLTAVTNLSNVVTPPNVDLAITQINTSTPDNVLIIMKAITALTLSGTTEYVTNLSKVDPSLLTKPALNYLHNLTSDQIASIATNAGNSEAYTILANANIVGKFLEFSIKESAMIAAKAGKYKIVSNLITNYTGYISTSYKRLLVKITMANYKKSPDDVIMGNWLAGKVFYNSLNLICPVWMDINRDSNVVDNFSPWLTASADTLDILLHVYDTAISAALQSDNNYILTT